MKNEKATLLFFLLTIFGMVKAQDTGFTFNHFALSVKELEQSATFYKEALQLEEITNKTKMEGIRWFSLGEAKGSYLISLLSH